MKFYSASNNGVTAVISAEDAKIFGRVVQGGGDPALAGVKIFTFYHAKESEQLPSVTEKCRMIYTGPIELLHWLMDVHQVVENDSDSGWSGHVPFSNGFYAAEQYELKYVTTPQDVISAFGLTLLHTDETKR